MACFSPASPSTVWIFYGMLVFGVVLHLLGFCSPYWSQDDFANIGLWKRCYQRHGCSKTPYTSNYFEATQVFESLGFVMAFISLLFFSLFVFLEKKYQAFYTVGMVSAYTAGFCTTLGVIIYGCQSIITLSWAFALTLVAGILYWACAMTSAVYCIRIREIQRLLDDT